MNINLELYRIFYVVAQHKTITSAAQELLISQPAISKAIKNLEDQLGGPLFIRTQKGISLTEEGKVIYFYIQQAMELVQSAEHKFTDFMNLEDGTVRIGISQTLTKEILLPYLRQFHQTYPKIRIEIDTNLGDDLFMKLKRGIIDFIILNMPPQFHEDFLYYPLKEIHDCFIVNQNYQELTKEPIALENLNQYPLLLQPSTNNTRRFLDSFCEKHQVTLLPSMTLASYTLVKDFTKIGYGIGYATKEYIEKELKQKQLFELKVIPEIPPRIIGLLLSKQYALSFSARKLVALLLKQESF